MSELPKRPVFLFTEIQKRPGFCAPSRFLCSVLIP